eukprot:jgi/Psemu1/22160/gm1.22160_g
MTTSRRHNKRQAKSPSDVASLDDDHVPEEASETAARTNKVPAVPPQVLGTASDESSETATRTNTKVGVQAHPEDDSQSAGTKNHGVPLPPKKSHNSQTPSTGAPKYISQDNDVPEKVSKIAARTNKVPVVPTQVLGTVSDEFSDTAPKPDAEVNFDYQNHWRSAKKNLGSALMNPCPILGRVVYSISNEEKEEEKKKSLLGTFCPTPCQIDVMVNFFLYETDNSVAGKLELLITIKKYMLLYQEILVWYMDNVKYPPAPEKMDQGLWFYTKRDNSSSHGSQDNVAVMKQFLDGLMAKLTLRNLFILGAMVVYGEQLVEQGFHQEGGNMPSTGQFVLHYKDLVTNLCHIHFDFDKNIVTLSSLQLAKARFVWHPRPLAETLVELSDKLFSKKLEGVFLSLVDVQNMDQHFGKEGNKVYLSGVFKHLKGTNFKYHTFSDFKSWDCFKKTKPGKAQCKNKGSSLGDEYSASSSASTGMSDNENGLEYDPDDRGNSETEEEDKC